MHFNLRESPSTYCKLLSNFCVGLVFAHLVHVGQPVLFATSSLASATLTFAWHIAHEDHLFERRMSSRRVVPRSGYSSLPDFDRCLCQNSVFMKSLVHLSSDLCADWLPKRRRWQESVEVELACGGFVRSADCSGQTYTCTQDWNVLGLKKRWQRRGGPRWQSDGDSSNALEVDAGSRIWRPQGGEELHICHILVDGWPNEVSRLRYIVFSKWEERSNCL